MQTDTRSVFHDALRALVSAESPSADANAVLACADVVSDLGARLLGFHPAYVTTGDRVALMWDFGGPSQVLVLGHIDTVWPLGTTQRWPFQVQGDQATGPGIFDMKAGIVMALMCVAAVEDRTGIRIILNADEELGSPYSRNLIMSVAKAARAAMVFEPSEHGALKTARKGVSRYEVSASGRASHPGLDPGAGANAISALARVIGQLDEVQSKGGPGTAIAPTMVSGGTAQNTIPASARVMVDVRVPDDSSQELVDSAMHALSNVDQGVTMSVSGGPTRRPMTLAHTRRLFEYYVALAQSLGYQIEGREVGGVSDGNLCAEMNTPTLDGLGAIGGMAHAEGEFINISQSCDRLELSTLFLKSLLSSDFLL